MRINRIIVAGIGMAFTACLFSCGGERRSPGRAYMPDMTYPRAYETYSSGEKSNQERLNESGTDIKPTYSALPVKGTIARGEMAHYKLANDSTGYRLSAGLKNPLDIAAINMKEAERLYLINCGICHGSKLDGNGPLYNGGNGPFLAAPKNFLEQDMKDMTEGTMFHSVTYGKGAMGSYASQLNPAQRWEVIAYIKSKQGFGKTAVADSGAVKADTVGTAMKK